MLTTLTVLWSHLFSSALMSLKERIKVFWPFSELLLKSDRRQSRWNSRSCRVLPWITPGPDIGGTSSDLQLQTLRCFSFCVFLRSTLFFVYFPVLEFGNNFDVTSTVWFSYCMGPGDVIACQFNSHFFADIYNYAIRV